MFTGGGVAAAVLPSGVALSAVRPVAPGVTNLRTRVRDDTRSVGRETVSHIDDRALDAIGLERKDH